VKEHGHRPSKNLGNWDSFQKQLASSRLASFLFCLIIGWPLSSYNSHISKYFRGQRTLCAIRTHAIVPAPFRGTHTVHTSARERYSRSSSSSDRRPLVGFGRESQRRESFFFISRGTRGSNLELPAPLLLPTYSRLFNSFVSISTLSSFLIIIPNRVERGRLVATVHLGRKQTGRLNHVSS
jgi:hypothetical protein